MRVLTRTAARSVSDGFERSVFNRSLTFPATVFNRRAFTLFEVLIVMGLLVVIFAAIWGIVEMFQRSFVRGETRAERSTLVRSLSQLVTDDLGCAIQDPLHPARELNANAVRRFGLSGTNTSLRIDVLQINPFRTGGMTTQYGVQAPELKTVYYDYTLLSPTGGGLVRRELDFETPSGMSGQQNAANANMGDDFDSPVSLSAIGSETRSLADYGSTSLTDSVSAANIAYAQQQPMAMMPPEIMAANAAARYAANEKLQLEMSAPEVVGCWFRYYDGSQWRDNWNSLNRRGLPVAIEITLKMMPLAEARTLRESPWAAQVVNGPGVSTVVAANEAAYANQYAANMAAMRQNASAIGSSSSLADYGSGSLTDRAMPTTLTDSVMQQNMMRNQPVGVTVEQLAEQLDLLPPTEQRIVIRVPTTPLTSQKELQREQPTASGSQTAQTSARPRQQAQRTQSQRSVEQPRGTASPNAQRSRPTGNRQSTSPGWIRQ
ncbi:MAG: prepilin-type N-terminal cleavage/methylation domain-containing protein [Planctomycetaceae bacterium]|nr:prepilin-type N-terminal cleavage/methylation domain-containing protein [Planctomycetaceae bacterium]